MNLERILLYRYALTSADNFSLIVIFRQVRTAQTSAYFWARWFPFRCLLGNTNLSSLFLNLKALIQTMIRYTLIRKNDTSSNHLVDFKTTVFFSLVNILIALTQFRMDSFISQFLVFWLFVKNINFAINLRTSSELTIDIINLSTKSTISIETIFRLIVLFFVQKTSRVLWISQQL